jgi:hypothetical protein
VFRAGQGTSKKAEVITQLLAEGDEGGKRRDDMKNRRRE